MIEEQVKFPKTTEEDITLEIIRENGENANWLNRFCKQENVPSTLLFCQINMQEIVYYCETGPESMIRIHRGNKDGPIISETCACLVTPGVTDVNFVGPISTIELDHLQHEDVPSMTRFSLDGKVYYWNGHSELVSVETGELLARFYPSWLAIDVREHKLGKLVITGEGKSMIDEVVATALVVQERSDRRKTSCIPPVKYLLTF